ncbi:MAG: YesL family protein [Clostridia bacterium]|nr:YesL family protein [Clostridia bacterium]
MGLFNGFSKPGKGVKKQDVTKEFTARRFFTTLGDKFWRIVVLNMLFFATNLPVFGLWASAASVGGVKYLHPANVLFQPLAGVIRHGASPVLNALYGVVGVQVENYYGSAITRVLFWVGLLVIFTFGVSTAAMTFILRNFIRREPADLGADYFGTIRKNWKQGILLGLLDVLFIFVIAFDLVSYLTTARSFLMLIMMYLTIFLSFLYFCMRPYLYLQIITFDVKLGRAVKNAYIMAIAGIWRNLLFAVIAIAIAAANVVLFMFLPPVGAVAFFALTVALCWYVQLYGAWPVLKKHMIDPFYEEKEISPAAEEAVFRDQG